MRTYLNLGCGRRFHPDWTNIDLIPHGPGVIAHDLSRGIPLPDESCEVVYHSHVLEHLRREHALPFLRECRRVLKPGCILRIAVPDLEGICRAYLETLDRAERGEPQAAADRQWMTLELYDQTVREREGGGMLDYLRQQPLPNEPFVLQRIGVEGREILQASRQLAARNRGDDQMIPKNGPSGALNRLRVLKQRWRARLLANLLGTEGQRALELGRFRLAGEIHCWMYDRFGLADLIREAGFAEPTRVTAVTSRIPNWNSFHLDTLPDGAIVKPDSIFMEGVKPVR
jgi:SAM-dependent methyltransferase